MQARKFYFSLPKLTHKIRDKLPARQFGSSMYTFKVNRREFAVLISFDSVLIYNVNCSTAELDYRAFFSITFLSRMLFHFMQNEI